ncbi:hypothetical protein WJX79_006395 [Trebouxia sp. C0005]
MSPPPGSGNQTKPSAVEWLKVYCGDNATVSWRKQAARTGDGSSPAEGKPRARRAFSSLVAVMAVLLQGLLPETGKGREQTRQL